MAPVRPSKTEIERRRIVGINSETVTNITSTDFPGHHAGEEAAWSLNKFKQGLEVKFHHCTYDEASFSLVGLDASIANAFRRILIAEVPTLAIETCYFNDNTSVIADEVLAHRLGLVPLKASLKGLEWMKWLIKPDPENGIEGMEYKDYNTIVLTLKVKCEWKPNPPVEGDPEEKYSHSNIYASDIKWIPTGRQAEMFEDMDVQPVNPGILIAKLRPGQQIDIHMHAVLGKGGDHAKFSPVGTATYRLMPRIEIIRPILGQDALKFQKCFPEGVIGIDRVSAQESKKGGVGFQREYEGREGDEKAVVQDPMRDTVSRECLRHDEFKDKVKLGRVQDHFIFNIETTGQYPSDHLFLSSVKVLKGKAKRLLRALDELESA